MADQLENTYGDRFEKLLPKTISDIEREIDRLADPILNGSVADRQKLTYLLENEAELKRYVNDRYGITYTEATGGAYAESLSSNKDLFEGEGIAFGFRQDQLDTMSYMKRSNVLLWNIETSKSANIIFDSMISWAYSGDVSTLAPFEAQVGAMGASRYGSTIINTQISAFNRSVTAMAAEQAGVDRFIYRGPQDGKVRDFCAQRINKVFTTEEINAMDNGQTGDPMTTGGGYNCRHRWVPVQGNNE